MIGRFLARAAIAACALASFAGSIEAADAPCEKLIADWSKASDDERQALLDAAAAAPSRPVIDALFAASKKSLGIRKEGERLRKVLEAHRKELGEDVPESDPRLDRERIEAANLATLAQREVAALDKLAAVVGRVLDAMPEDAVSKTVRDLLEAAPDPQLEGFRAFTGQAIGSSRLVRTSVALIDTPPDARREIAKLSSQRAEPARKLEDVLRKLNDLVGPYLKAARAKGDDSGMVPTGLVGRLPDQRDELDKIVNRLGSQIDAADDRRRTAREALTRMLSSMVAADGDRIIDMLESRVLKDENVEDRAFGYATLGLAPGPRPLRLLAVAADGKDPRDAAAALEALGYRTEPEIVSMLAKHLVDDEADWRVRTSAAEALARTGRAIAVPPLLDAMKTAKGRLVDDLRDALASLSGQRYPAVEPPWRAWWDIAGKDFVGPKDPRKNDAKPEKPVAGVPGEKAPPSAVASKGDDGFAFYGIESHSTRMLFILDFSGSMMWAGSATNEKVTKIDVLRREMKKSLAGLPDGATFNLIAFSSDVRPWMKVPQIRSTKTATDALIWVEKAPVDGGTNIGDALEAGFKMMGVGLQKDRNEPPAFDTVFFMTDGKPSVGKVTDPKQILAAVRRWNDGRKVKIHVVGMGGHEKPAPVVAGAKPKNKDKEADMDEDFLKALAEQNGGQCVIH